MLFKILHGDDSRISLDVTPYHEGYCYVTYKGDFYVDMNNKRTKLNAKDTETLMGAVLSKILNSSDTEIPTSKAVTDAIANLIKDIVSVADNGSKVTKSEGIVTLDWDPDVVFVFNGGTSVINV